MFCFRYIFALVLVILKLSDGVKVDMKGSLSLGKEVVNALRSFVTKTKLGGRRLEGGEVDLESEKDMVALIVHSSFICRDIKICKGALGTFLNQYLIMLGKAVESVFEGLVTNIGKKNNQNSTTKAVIFEFNLKRLIREIKSMLRNASRRIAEENQSYVWIDLLKRINAKFQEAAITFAGQKLEGNVQEVTEVKTKVTQKLIIATTLVELKFEDRLCIVHKICTRSHEVTKALNTFLVQLNSVSEDKTKQFIKQFYETLPVTNFYYRISDVTGHEFQTILHDMFSSDSIPAKNVLATIQRIVEERLKSLNLTEKMVDKPMGRDVKLINVMLSDMDHFYTKQKKEPFHDFLSDFFDWTQADRKFNAQLRRIMKDLQNNLSFESDELVFKLVNEMRVFLEITVDPDT